MVELFLKEKGLTPNLSIFLQAEKVFNQDLYFKKTVKFVGEPMSHLESIASSAVFIIFNSSCSLQLYLFSLFIEW